MSEKNQQVNDKTTHLQGEFEATAAPVPHAVQKPTKKEETPSGVFFTADPENPGFSTH